MDFSRPYGDFQVLFKEDLIIKDFSRQTSLSKFFSSLCEPCHGCDGSIQLYGYINNSGKTLEFKEQCVYSSGQNFGGFGLFFRGPFESSILKKKSETILLLK